MPRNKHKRDLERVGVVHWLFHWVVAPKGAVLCQLSRKRRLRTRKRKPRKRRPCKQRTRKHGRVTNTLKNNSLCSRAYYDRNEFKSLTSSFYSCPGRRPWARVIICVGFFFFYYFSSARKWTNCAIVPMRPCGLRMLYFRDSWNEASEKRSHWDFSRMLIVMSVKPTLTDELLKVNSALKPIFSVIEDQCSGGQYS